MTLTAQITQELHDRLKAKGITNYTLFDSNYSAHKIEDPNQRIILIIGRYYAKLTLSKETWQLKLTNEYPRTPTNQTPTKYLSIYTIDLDKVLNDMVEWVTNGYCTSK